MNGMVCKTYRRQSYLKKIISFLLTASLTFSLCVIPKAADDASQYIKNITIKAVLDDEGQNPNNEYYIQYDCVDKVTAMKGAGFAVVLNPYGEEDLAKLQAALDDMTEHKFLSEYKSQYSDITEMNSNGVYAYEGDFDGYGDVPLIARCIVPELEEEPSSTSRSTGIFTLPVTPYDETVGQDEEWIINVIFWTLPVGKTTGVDKAECISDTFYTLQGSTLSVRYPKCKVILDPNYVGGYEDTKDNIDAHEYNFSNLRKEYFPDDPVREGYNFVGWMKYKNDEEIIRPNDWVVLEAPSTKFYAKWEKKVVKLTLTEENFSYESNSDTYLYYNGEAQLPTVDVVAGGDLTEADIDYVKDLMIIRCDADDIGKDEGEEVTQAIDGDERPYPIYIEIPENEKFNSAIFNIGSFWIQPAKYIIDADDLEQTVDIGTVIQNHPFPITARDVNGDVPGTLTITSDAEDEKAVANKDYENLSWSFVPTLSDGEEFNPNYQVPTTGTGLILHTKPKTIIKATLVVPEKSVTYGDVYDADGNYCVTLNVVDNSGNPMNNLVEGTHYQILYKNIFDGDYSPLQPVNAGMYDIKMEWKDGWGDYYELRRDSTVESEINDNKGLTIDKRALTISYPVLAKAYDGTDKVYKKYVSYGSDENEELTLDDVSVDNFVYDETLEWNESTVNRFVAYYTSANSSDEPIPIKVTGLVLASGLSGNYSLPSADTEGIITKKTATATLKDEYKNKEYGAPKLLHLNSVQFDFDGLLRGDVVENYPIECNALNTTADVGEYDIKIGTPTEGNSNYSFSTGSKVYVTQAEYTAPAADPVTGVVVSGPISPLADIYGAKIEGNVTDVFGNTVSGKFVITSNDKGRAAAGKVYENLDWKFEPDSSDGNYKELTGSGARLISDGKQSISDTDVKITVPTAAVYNSQEQPASAEIEGFDEDDFHIEYSKRNTSGLYEPISYVPKDSGSYRATVVLDGDAAGAYELSNAYKNYSIAQRTVTIKFPDEITKPYDKTTTAKINGSDMTSSDLTLVNRADGDSEEEIYLTTEEGKSFAANYTDEDVGTRKYISVNNVVLGGEKKNNYTIEPGPYVARGDITAKEITAKVSPLKLTKEYGKTTELSYTDLITYELEDGDTLEGYNVTSDGTARKAEVKENNGGHAIIITTPQGGNYKVTTDDVIVVEPTEYHPQAEITSEIGAGMPINGFKIAGTVKDIDNEDVAGNYVINEPEKGNTVAKTPYNNLNWVFVPNDSDINYKTLTGSNASLLTNDKLGKLADIVAANAVYDKEEKTATVSIDGLTDDDFDIVYSVKNDDDSYTDLQFPPVNAGTYKATAVLKGNADERYTLSNVSAVYTISKKPLTVIYPENITKIYDKTADVKISGRIIEVSDFGLNNIIAGDTVIFDTLATLKHQYTSINYSESPINILFDGLKLQGGDSANYVLPNTFATTGMITRKPITAVVAEDKLTKVFGTAASFTCEDLTADGLEDGDTLDGYIIASDGTAVSAGVNADGYDIIIDAPDKGNYTVTTDSKLVVIPASYIPPENIEGSVAILSPIEGAEIEGSVKDVNGGNVDGKFVITSSDEGVAEADKVYTNLSWRFVPDIADANYNELTGTNAKLTAASKTDKTAIITLGSSVYDGTAKTASAIIDGLTAEDFNIAYSVKTADGYEALDSAPIRAGEYKAVVSLTGAAASRYNLLDGEKEYIIAPKTLTIKYPENITKIYDGTADAPISVTDLGLIGVIDGDNTIIDPNSPFTAVYSDNGSGADKTITLGGVTITGADADNYTLTKLSELTGTIERKPITAALADNKKTKIYGGELTLDYSDIITSELAEGDTLEGYTVTSAGTAKTADANTDYAITVTAPENGNYVITVNDTISVNPAQYKPQEKLEGSINAQSSIEGYKIRGTVTDIDGNTVSGNYIITDTDKGNAVSKTEYTDLSWRFEPDEANANYGILTGTGFTLITTQKKGGSSGGGSSSSSKKTPTPTATPTPEATAEPEPTETTEPAEPTEAPRSSGLIRSDFTEPYASGYEDGKFLPKNPITRAEVAAIMSRLAGFDETDGSYTASFSDVSEDTWYDKYIGYAQELGVMSGYEDGTFHPNDSITRAEICTVIAKAQKMEITDSASIFPDVADSYWGRGFIMTLAEADIVSGYEDGTFHPHSMVTRAETVAIIAKVLPPSEPVITVIPTDIAGHWAENAILLAVNERIIK